MQQTTSREKVLKKIRKALIQHRAKPFSGLDWEKNIHVQTQLSLEETFAKAFATIGGHFIFCESEIDFLEHHTHITIENNWKPVICNEKKICELLDEVAYKYLPSPPLASGDTNAYP